MLLPKDEAVKIAILLCGPAVADSNLLQRTARLPEPDAAARDASAALVVLIRAAIAASGGAIPFARYMELALYTSGLGYYSGGAQKFGTNGDFVTAPEISPLFGQTLARQVAQVCAVSAPRVLEFGAGSGKLAAHVLIELERLGAPCERYAILELSGELRARQRETVTALAPQLAHKVAWLDALPENIEGCVIANEVLDAMPVHLITWRDAGACEQMVTATAEGFAFAGRPLAADLKPDANALASVHALPDGYTSELHIAARAWMRELAQRLTCGAALMIDYGFPAAEYYHSQRATGTLKAHYRHHSLDDPFFWPGLTDITAHVDFTAIALAAQDAGLDVDGYTTQAQFLINCGITRLLESAAPQNAADGMRHYLTQSNRGQRLLSPAEMGELFKVLAVSKGLNEDWLGFVSGNRVHTL